MKMFKVRTDKQETLVETILEAKRSGASKVSWPRLLSNSKLDESTWLKLTSIATTEEKGYNYYRVETIETAERELQLPAGTLTALLAKPVPAPETKAEQKQLRLL